MNARAKKILKALANKRNIVKTKKVLHQNPTTQTLPLDENKSVLDIYEYNANEVKQSKGITEAALAECSSSNNHKWLNLDVVTDGMVEKITSTFKVHSLIREDIINLQQRPRVDEIDNQIFCVLQMMYFSDIDNSIESEQVSMVLGHNYLLSFQEDETRDNFATIRQKLMQPNSKVRTSSIDFLLYSLLDAIVDNYYQVMDKLSIKIEHLEEAVTHGDVDDYTMSQINDLRKELIMFRRNVLPVRDVLHNLTYTENKLIQNEHKRYFKDVLDHVVQAIDLSENYRDIVANIRDLYINQINLRTNEVMKFLAIVTTLLAPATVLGGIFGMNFDNLPWQHNHYGFYFVGIMMIGIPIIMLWWFRRRGWF